jgi:putative acetyltransferase
MHARWTVRAEESGDAAAVDALLRRAFPSAGEALLVARLRSEGAAALGFVAERAGRVVGHVLFSAVTIEGDGASWPGSGLGPMAVEPDAQRRGIGSALVRAGLAASAAAGERLVFVLGHPDYYPRFGFRLAAPLGLRYGDGAFDRAFFVCELAPGALGGARGRIRYHPAFDEV